MQDYIPILIFFFIYILWYFFGTQFCNYLSSCCFNWWKNVERDIITRKEKESLLVSHSLTVNPASQSRRCRYCYNAGSYTCGGCSGGGSFYCCNAKNCYSCGGSGKRCCTLCGGKGR